MKARTGRAKMPWDGDISHTKLSDGRVALRGSQEEAIDRYGEERMPMTTSRPATHMSFNPSAIVSATRAMCRELYGDNFDLHNHGAQDPEGRASLESAAEAAVEAYLEETGIVGKGGKQ